MGTASGCKYGTLLGRRGCAISYQVRPRCIECRSPWARNNRVADVLRRAELIARAPCIVTAYMQGSQGLMIVYDVTNLATFESVKFWMGEIKKTIKRDNVPKILVRTSVPLRRRRAAAAPPPQQQRRRRRRGGESQRARGKRREAVRPARSRAG